MDLVEQRVARACGFLASTCARREAQPNHMFTFQVRMEAFEAQH